MRRVSKVGATLSTGTGTRGKDSTPLVLEEDHLHSNFTSVRAKTVSGGCCCFLLNSLKNKKSLTSRPKILISNVVLNPESYCTRRKLLLSFSIQKVCFVVNLTSSYWLGGLLLPMYLLWICRTCLFLWMGKTVRGYLGQHLNLGLKYMLKDKNACKYLSESGLINVERVVTIVSTLTNC